ncbi:MULTISPECIES: vanadium-dependent haloperoxidase [unclassified Robiginitalea]|uniref:vanadium-dependent haloperoxidase n=1 Tax=Robiginitalea TaxID=252306 RepID=UPI00234A6122|nr:MULTISPECIES: vanadium-dependent haloperoxidase [unclassified Robiginitalea]MDC6352856.1 vanadium-dependent haloperoxidase [Robiginitalea sp. PM2]MDC6373978.1 vanadium-dependent haloperoxidase [Robiginitalea sp. SP8]
MKTNIAIVAALSFLLLSCSGESEPITISPEDYHASVDKVTEVMVHDIFSPPVASRIYVYPNIAAYEIMALHNPAYKSLAGQVTDLEPIPSPEAGSGVNYPLAALVAHMDLSRQLIFSEERVTEFRDSLYSRWSEINEEEFVASRDYGLEVAAFISEWMDKDNYKQTRTMSKFTVNTDEPSRWQPTPPAYMEGIEPHWNKIRTLVIDSAAQFKPAPPVPFSMEEGSDFHRELMEVYEVGNAITEKGDESEEVAIARFWDCNPYVSVTRGHLMFATKKISPGAHWIGIAKIACRKDGSDFDKTVFAYTKTSIALFDGFISCWDEKYRSNLIRPETLINQHIDDSWKPVLQTPPFPEYTSGHSVVSGAAATALTSIFGDNFAFDDDTELPYGLPVRSFNSFNEASAEAAISRMYGGIHYRMAIEVGLDQGRSLGGYVVDQLEMNQRQTAMAATAGGTANTTAAANTTATANTTANEE